ncbi:hypothetical protein JHK85_036638 [Glycine max]|uniref:Uncharacterized protein n=1 Tax=Glycine soja TaxID=3848 RepID=A0A0B2PJK7_GLYSO|nr:hypothetical protein JHK85_036638 [Glycine max]KAG4976624.1 hypothetical protein JHK86_036098 [Glycine max]KHN07919.1 hypothetical protein glysoja_032463 [Glycine soja]
MNPLSLFCCFFPTLLGPARISYDAQTYEKACHQVYFYLFLSYTLFVYLFSLFFLHACPNISALSIPNSVLRINIIVVLFCVL